MYSRQQQKCHRTSSSHRGNSSCSRLQRATVVRWQVTSIFRAWGKKLCPPADNCRSADSWGRSWSDGHAWPYAWQSVGPPQRTFLAAPCCWCSWLQPIRCSAKFLRHQAPPASSSQWYWACLDAIDHIPTYQKQKAAAEKSLSNKWQIEKKPCSKQNYS